MKKVLALLLAGALTLGMSVTAFASSPAGEEDPIKGTSDQGKVVTSTADDAYTSAELQAVKALEKNAAGTLEKAVGADAAKGMKLLSVFDVEIDGWDFENDGAATITFAFPSVKADSKVIVLHYTNGNWQQEPAKAGKGTITVTLKSASPLAVFVDQSASANAVSPKTGEIPAMTMIVAVAVVAVAGMAVSIRRRHA